MTKTESAEHIVKTLAIESCEQWLQCGMAAGVRAAIPNTNNLIMVGPQEWIAKNVPGVEAMVAGAALARIPQTADEAIAFIGGHFDYMDDHDNVEETRYQLSVHDLLSAFRWWFEDDLAATTQASTAQAEAGAIISEAIAAAFEERAGWRVKIAAAVRALDSTDAQAAAEVLEPSMYEIMAREKARRAGLDAALDVLRAGDTGEQADGGAA